MAAKTKAKKQRHHATGACDRFLVTWIDHDPKTGLLQGSGGCTVVFAGSLEEARSRQVRESPGRVPGVTLCGCCLPDLLSEMEQLTAETKLGDRQFHMVIRIAGVDLSKPWWENSPDYAASQPMMLPALDADEALRYARDVARPQDLPYAALTMEELRSGIARQKPAE